METRAGLSVLGRAVALAALASLAWSVGCGSVDRPPPASESSSPGPSGPVSGGGFGGDGGVSLPGCGTKADGSSCDCVDVPLFTDPPNLYLILDRSGSMSEDGKWDAVRSTVAALARGLGPRARFGAAMYPALSDVCAPGREVLVTRDGDPPSASGADGPTTSALVSVTNVAPRGGTPTSASLAALLPTVRAIAGKTFVILATDGAPNCNGSATCTIDQCLPNMEGVCPAGLNCCEAPTGGPENCLDASATVTAARSYAQAGIPLYVIGIPGSGAYASLLDQVAVAGGTPLPGSPKYYRVDDKGQILDALKKVAARIVATCTYDLSADPASPDLVNVYLDGAVVPKDPVDGWSIDGKRVTLLGQTCERVLAGDVLSVRIIAGCPTVLPR